MKVTTHLARLATLLLLLAATFAQNCALCYTQAAASGPA